MCYKKLATSKKISAQLLSRNSVITFFLYRLSFEKVFASADCDTMFTIYLFLCTYTIS